MAEDRIEFSHSGITGSSLRKPLTPVIPNSYPGGLVAAADIAWPLPPEQEPERIVAADQTEVCDDAVRSHMELLIGSHLAPMCWIGYDYLLSAESAEVFFRFDLVVSTLKRVPVVKQSGEEFPGDWYFCTSASARKHLSH